MKTLKNIRHYLLSVFSMVWEINFVSLKVHLGFKCNYFDHISGQ